MRLFLVGFMGAGKSTVGKLLGERLVMTFNDLDDFIEKREGLPVPLIFKQRGEESFRLMESAALDSWIRENQTGILSCGGGTPCFLGNSRKMNGAGIVVFLDADPAELARRLESESEKRPLLGNKKGAELQSHIDQLLQQRMPFYRQATISVNVAGSPEEVVQKIEDQLKQKKIV